jgi:uncharacterized membrane protein/osmotically-inducible protein OsmY
MKQASARHQGWTKLIGSGAALGAVAMYILDPQKGRRRRAVARDKVIHLVDKADRMINVATRDFSSRLQGVQARLRQRLKREKASDDAVLASRVRARLGRAVSHSHAIGVTALHGQITLSGPVLASEKAQLLDAVRAVPGVAEIDDKLDVHERPDHISSLQGGTGRPPMRSEFMRKNWTPALRAAAVLSGGIAGLYGLKQRNFSGLALAGIGLGLVARGVTNIPMRRLMGQGPPAFNLQKTIHIAAAPEAVFDLWRQYENFPYFMSHVEEVRDLDNGRSHWIVKGPAGSHVEWNAIVTQSIHPKLLAWRSEPGSLVKHSGYVYFEPFNSGTRVTIRMSYSAAGGLGRALAVLLGSDPKQKLNDDLMRMKTFIETGVRPHDAARQPPSEQVSH